MRYPKKLLICLCVITIAVVLYTLINDFLTLPQRTTEYIKIESSKFLSSVLPLDTDKSMEEIQTEEDRIWYDPARPEDDRIFSQLRHIPKSYRLLLEKGSPPKTKLILRYYGFKGHDCWGGDVQPGEKTFENCLVSRCSVVSDKSRINEMDAVVFEYDHPERPREAIPESQIWLTLKTESPYSSRGLERGDEMNWTASYRRDSTLVVPYGKLITIASSMNNTKNRKNYAEGKTKMVAWIVSNCSPRNNRNEYAQALAKHIPVDIYGRCGTKKKFGNSSIGCLEILRKEYKFYLSFENANCRDYITEKFFRNALRYDMIPIALGAAPYDYRQVAPPHSYIHVEDFDSPRQLASYLHRLDNNDTMYNEYFKWKETFKIKSIRTETKFWCRLCSLLHEQDNQPHSWYTDTNEWWRRQGTCIGRDQWKQHPGSNESVRPAHIIVRQCT